MKFFAQKPPLSKGHLGPKATNCALPPGPPRIQTPLTMGPHTCHSLCLPASPSRFPWSCLFPIVCSFRVPPSSHSASKGCSCDCSLIHGCGCTFPSGDSRSLESSDGRLTCDVVGGEETLQCRRQYLHSICLLLSEGESLPSVSL